MSFHLSTCVPEDAPEIAHLHLDATSSSPLNQLTFGDVDPGIMLDMLTKGLRAGIENASPINKMPEDKDDSEIQHEPTIKSNATDVNSAEDPVAVTATNPSDAGTPASSQHKYWLKLTDSTTSKIVSYAFWIHYPEGYNWAEEDKIQKPPSLPLGSNEIVYKEFKDEIAGLRREHIAYKPHWLLGNLATHPSYQRKGAASQLVKWAFPRAEADGVMLYLDASPAGYLLYKKLGFEQVGDLTIDMEKFERGNGLGIHKHIAMIKESIPPLLSEENGRLLDR